MCYKSGGYAASFTAVTGRHQREAGRGAQQGDGRQH